MGYINPSGVSFGSIQRSFLTPPNSHLRQGLNPAMPAQPVGPSPGFRAVACVCMVTSPNKVEVASRSLRTSCASLLYSISLNTNGLGDLSRKKIQIEAIISDLVSRNLATHRFSSMPSGAWAGAVGTWQRLRADGADASRCTMSLCRRSADFSVSLFVCLPKLAHRIRWLISMPTTRMRSGSSVLTRSS